MSASIKLTESLKSYLHQGYVFCPDTNFIMNAPDVLRSLKGEKIVIARQTHDELDGLKSASDNERKSYEAREGIRALDVAGATIIEPASKETFTKYHLKNTPDDRIIASAMDYRDKSGNKVVFLTLDRGAKMVAKSAGLETIPFDIDSFYEEKNKANRKNISKTPHLKQKNSKRRRRNPLKFALGILFLFIIIGVLFNGVDFKEAVKDATSYRATAEVTTLVDGQLTIEPIYIVQVEKGGKIEVMYEATNNYHFPVDFFVNPDLPLTINGTGPEVQNHERRKEDKAIYGVFEDGRKVMAWHTPLNVTDETKSRSTFFFKEGDLSKLKEIQSSIVLKDKEERIPFTVKIKEVKTISKSEALDLATMGIHEDPKE